MSYQVIQQSKIQNPIISIVTPTYNVEAFIEEQVNSLVNQDLPGVELVIVDDGSSDNTLSILKQLGEKHPEITLVSQENQGPSRARNVGLELFRGEYLYFVDADDIVPSGALKALYEAAQAEGADIVTGRSLSFNSTGSWYIGGHYNAGLFNEGMRSFATNPELVYSLGPASKLYKRKIIENLRMPENIKIGEDQPFVLEALLRSQKIYTIDAIVYNYRSRETDEASLSQIVSVDPLIAFLEIRKSLFVSLPLFKKYLTNQYVYLDALKTYFERVVRFDLWPSIREVLKLQDGSIQKQVFSELIGITKELPEELFAENIFYFQMLTVEMVERYKFIQKEAHGEYIRLLKTLFDKIESGVFSAMQDNVRISEAYRKMSALKQSVKYQTTLPIFLFLAKRRLVKESKILSRKAKTFIQSRTLTKVMYPIYRLVLPKTKVLFLTNKEANLTGTFRMVYDEVRKHEELTNDIRCHLKTNTRSFSAQRKLLKDVASAKYIFLDDYYRQIYGLKTSKKTEVIQLWHAAGAFKKFGFGAIGSLESNTVEFEMAAHQNYTKVICSSKEVVPYYAEAFHVAESQVLPLGVPRADKLLDEEYRTFIHNRFLRKHPQVRGRKVITYAPTFRGGPKVRQQFKMMLNLRKFVDRFSDEYILAIKMHPSVSKSQGVPFDLKDDILNLSAMDMNDLLISTDVLITDYSSVIFDYSLLNRPIIFYAYDLEEYIAERDFYYEYQDFVPGPIVRTNEELFSQIDHLDEIDLQQVGKFKNTFFDQLDGQSAKRIVDLILY